MSSLRGIPTRLFWTLCLLAAVLTACVPATTFPSTTVTTTSSPAPTKPPTPTPTSTPTLVPATATPPTLPGPYQNNSLTPYGTPHTYFQDTCQVLRDKWSSANSSPGTVVMVIMFHSITGGNPTNSNQISEFKFRTLMKRLHDDGFVAVGAAQMAGFLEHNTFIPERSVLLVVDDRHYAPYFNNFFREYWSKYDWPVVNAWISAFGGTDPALAGNIALSREGWVDYQAHGASSPHIPIDPNSTDEFILHDLQGSLDNIQKYFGKAPIAYIWPGGGFTPHAVQISRQVGYRLGFTTNPRGPVMFNWVPLADQPDVQRPDWIPEGPVKDPLMVLPRYWDTDAILHINDVIQIGQEAAAYSELNKSTELKYYDIVCSPKYGPIP